MKLQLPKEVTCVLIHQFHQLLGFPGGSEVKASACNAEDWGSIPGSGRSPGEGNGNPLQYSCLESPMDGGAWWAIVHGVAKSQTRLSDFTFTFTFHQLLVEGCSRVVSISPLTFLNCHVRKHRGQSRCWLPKNTLRQRDGMLGSGS